MADDKPVIIIKKGGGHGGHHGGAWKVAYADFVTAMMAFFMVMWLLNTVDSATRKNIAHYFNNPGVFAQGGGSPMFNGGQGILPDQFVASHPERVNYNFGRSQDERTGVSDKEGGAKQDLRYEPSPGRDQFQQGESNERIGKDAPKLQVDATPIAGITPIPELEGISNSDFGAVPTPPSQGATAGSSAGAPSVGANSGSPTEGTTGGAAAGALTAQLNAMNAVAEQIRQQILTSPELKELLGEVDVKIDADGLNVEIMDTDKTSMFTSGSARILPDARAAFAKLASIIAPLPNRIDIVGHTDALPFGSAPGGYSNWELSADRANAARRLLQAAGIPDGRFSSVIGRADQELKKPDDPKNASNRRITLRMRFNLSTTVNVAKDPEALTRLKVEEQAFQKREEEKVHSMSPQQVLNPSPIPSSPAASARNEGDPIKLPEEAATLNPGVMPQDKIFGDSPVFGSTPLLE